MKRTDIPRDLVMDFATAPHGVFYTTEAQDFMDAWDKGVKWPRGFVALDGFVCKFAQDHALTHEQTESLRDEVFMPRAQMR